MRARWSSGSCHTQLTLLPGTPTFASLALALATAPAPGPLLSLSPLPEGLLPQTPKPHSPSCPAGLC